MKRVIFIAVGFLSFGLGSVGVILPVLPTTPFLLLSAYCFTRGSRRFEIWLKHTKLYRAYVSDYLETRSIPWNKKWKILINIYLLMGFSIYFVPLTAIKILLGMLTVFQTIYLFFIIPTR